MRFATRIFLVTSAVSAAGVLAATSLVYLASEDVYRRHYFEVYRQRLELVAKDFTMLEAAYDRIAGNAARVVRERLKAVRGGLPESELAQLATELGVRRIAIVDENGNFLSASDGRHEGNLFSFCSSYRELIAPGQARDAAARHTPLLPERGNSSSIVSYTLLPGPSGKRIIDVSVGFAELGGMLLKLAEDESDIEHVVLRAPSGAVLGDVGHLTGNDTQLRVTVPADESECCECRTRGAHDPNDPSKPYTYEFIADISLKSLNASIGALRVRFAAVLVLVLAAALGLAFWVSRVLVDKILRVRRAMDEITSSRDFSRELPLEAREKARDEIDALAAHFNTMARAMREAQRAEARASIAAQVAHDIRSPLTSMMLALNQLQGSLKSDARAAVAEMLSALSNGISRVNGIVNRLSNRKPAPGGAEPPVEAPRLTLVDKLLFDVAQEHALKQGRTREFVITGFPPLPGVWAVVQVTELQAALSNLLNNAFEAVGSGGRVELVFARAARGCEVKVIDNGVGISAANLARVFEREFTSGKAGGSGLGLYQAKKAVEWCGGKIAIDSRPGAGTTVSFTLPVEKDPAWLSQDVTLAPSQLLVVVDDDPSVLAQWRDKATVAGVNPLEFQSFNALEAALGGLGPAEGLVFVLDQYASDGREGLTGLKFIEKHALGERAYLSTSEFDDPMIQDNVKRLRARMIPKPCLAGAKIILRS